MKATGIVRRIDDLGRVVIPKELRKVLDIEDNKTFLEFFVDDNERIIMKKYQPGCVLCGSVEDLVDHPTGKKVCLACLNV